MVYSLFKRNMKSGFKLCIIFMAIMTMYTSLIIYMYDERLAEMLGDFQKVMPEMMNAVGMKISGSSLVEFINTYLNGFIMLVVPMVFSMLLVNSFLMKYVDSGSMACLLSTPNSRRKIIRTQWISLGIMITILIIYTTGIGIISSQLMFPGKLNIGKYIIMNISILFIQYLIGGICFLAACAANATKTYLKFGVGIPLIFYIIQMIANMGGKLEGFKYTTIFTLMPLNKILSSNGNGLEIGTLGSNLIIVVIAIILVGIGEEIFIKKDLNL